MDLRLSREEFELTRTALIEYGRALREQARTVCTGYSPAAIELCERRLRLETLVDSLDSEMKLAAAV